MNDLYTAVMHDVKNQLAELALRLRERGDARVEMEIAMNASRRLTKVLLLGREESLWVNADTVNPADFLEVLAGEYSELFTAIAIKIDVERAPAWVFFDESLIRLALGNALHNACRHAKSRVLLSAFKQDNMLILEVADDGIGFLQSVLNLAGQLPAAVSGSGTGLGLYLANKIARLHQLNDQHGYIELSNDETGGRFRIALP